MALPLLRPDWDSPARALMSTRQGGVSQGAFASLNISSSVGDDPAAVARNRELVQAELGAPIARLHLVHGVAVIRVDRHSIDARPLPQADAAWSDDPEIACAVTAADCLPVLFSSPDGRVVAAAHAGWRGLAAGVLENTVAALAPRCAPAELRAWLGPCIGRDAFEVGDDVLRAFGVEPKSAGSPFRYRPRGDGSPRWLADLPALARDRLRAAGLRHLSGGHWCTASDASRFFSFRRDRITGRMVAAIVACR